ncbi:hypothetical protein ACFO3I_09950 [Rheinheimera marina]|uniref:Glycoside hydrolase family 5 domain-containing protein n=1 Tax=Rheinheimera marina TaxID=1774958 RepID=A0ABV9JM53_9GAMM
MKQRKTTAWRPSLLLTALAFASATAVATPTAAPTGPVKVDNGVMHWADGSEVALFGVNYSAPFAYGYRSLKRLGVDHKAAIRMDVAHMARLGLDAYRVHLWDRELADDEGNLLQNEHLELFDYLLAELEKHQIKVIITPIAWWGSGYPEPDPVETGFARHYSKNQMNEVPKAIAAQHRYLAQLMAHQNPLTGKTYAQDPNIIAFELFNEPKHGQAPAQSAAYIQGLIDVVRQAGVTKPLFYNTSEQGNQPDFAKALCETSIDGVAFQWYPTGLLKYSAINGNMLSAVAAYYNPFADIAACQNKAKMVYEFDAADVAASTMYPAMARSFRTAGMQWATQFAYDAAYAAHTNSEYNTHYLNLLYTPSKAISLMIAAEQFRQWPRLQQPAAYPASNKAGHVTLDPQADVALLQSDSQLLYSNSTDASAKNIRQLKQIAGVGSSALVQYQGNGAYFLDKQQDGLWRLELYPDVLELQDPYQNSSLRREARRLYSASRSITVQLPDLGQSYQLKAINAGNSSKQQAKAGTVQIQPGVYLLAKTTDQLNSAAVDNTYLLPESKTSNLEVEHHSVREAALKQGLPLSLRLGSSKAPEKVELLVRYQGDQQFTALPLHSASSGFSGDYQLELNTTEQFNRPGVLEYALVVTENGKQQSFPGNAQGSPQDWDFVQTQAYWQTRLVEAGLPVRLFSAALDQSASQYPQQATVIPKWLTTSEGMALQLGIADIKAQATDAVPLLKTTLSPNLKLDRFALQGYNSLSVKLRSYQPQQLRLALLDADGLAHGAEFAVKAGWQQVLIPLSQLKSVDTLLPQAYPTFSSPLLPAAQSSQPLQLNQLQGLQLQLLRQSGQSGWQGVELAEVSLLKR